MAQAPIRVLMIEDNEGDADLVREILGADPALPFQVVVAPRLAQGLQRLRDETFDVVLLDLDLPDSERSETFDRVHAAVPHVPVVVHSGSVDDAMATRAVQRGAQDSLVKGRVGPESLSRVLRFAIERKRAEETLLRLEEVTRRAETAATAATLMKFAPIPMIMVDGDLRIRLANEAAMRFAGLPPQETGEGRLLEDFLGCAGPAAGGECGPVATLASQAIRQGETFSGIEIRVRFREGRGRPGADVLVSTSCVALGDDRVALICLEDVTEARRAEESLRESRERMRQVQELEAIGRLAGGVAHDFNNLLAVIIGYAELIQSHLGLDDALQEGAGEILEAGRRGAALTRQLLAFGRKQVLRPQVIDLGETVAETGRMLRRLIGENIALELDAGTEPVRAVADLGQVEQVVMNLAINARDAMPDGGRLVLRTRRVDVSAWEVPPVPGARPGSFVRLDVEDAGCGMDPETLRHVFEPFYTTKAAGTGLGLSVVYGIVQQHQGWMNVTSEPGRGTCFQVYLPAAPEGAMAGDGAGAEATTQATGHGEPILVVEDEPALRRLAVDALEQRGYRVQAASGVAEARAVFGQDGTAFRLVFSDVVLPDGSGVQLAESLRALRPGLAVVLTSGYADHRAQGDRIRAMGFSFVQKPYTMAAVLQGFQEALAATAERPGGA